jgi:hypothetical protein
MTTTQITGAGVALVEHTAGGIINQQELLLVAGLGTCITNMV